MLSELTDMGAADDASQKKVDIVPGQRIISDDFFCDAVFPRLVMFPLSELADIDKAKRLLRVLLTVLTEDAMLRILSALNSMYISLMFTVTVLLKEVTPKAPFMVIVLVLVL